MQKTDTQTGLFRGQSHVAHFKRGAVIAVVSGSVRVFSRVSLEHDTLTVQTSVPRGGVFQVPCSGWLEITADSDALIGLTQRTGGLASLKRLCQTAARFHERFQPLARVLSSQDATT